TKCWSGSSVIPQRHGEYRFVVQIKSSDGDFSATWPYWVTASK
ncbi:MAG: hypothetical protein ACI9WU_004920, partial [Myxococcota bacterium]